MFFYFNVANLIILVGSASAAIFISKIKYSRLSKLEQEENGRFLHTA